MVSWHFMKNFDFVCVRVYLYSSMTAEVKVKLVGVGDVCVDCGAGRNVPTPSDLRKQGTG